MFRRAFILLGVSLLLLVSGSPVFAQTPLEDPRGTAKTHLGPFYATPWLRLNNFGVDSNVFNAAGEQSPDFVFDVNPGTDIWLPFAKRALLKAKAGADLMYFAKYETQRSINPSVSTRGELLFRRFKFFGEGSYLNTRERLNQEIDARARRLETATSGGVEVQVSKKVSLGFAGRRSTLRYGKDQSFRGINLKTSLDREERTVSGTARYVLTPLTTIAVSAETTDARFSVSKARDSHSFRILAGLEFRPRALIYGRMMLGVRRLRLPGLSAPSYRGLATSAVLTYVLKTETAIAVTADRDTGYSYDTINPYFVNSTLGLTVRRHLAGRFEAIGTLQHIELLYRALSGVSAKDRVDTADNLAGSLGYRVGKTGLLTVGMSHWRRDSNADLGYGYRGYNLGTGFSYGL